MGQFNYTHGTTTRTGHFNVYQARSGAIIFLMGKGHTTLQQSQIVDLNIDCYGLEDFNHDDFLAFYNITQK